MLFVVVRGVGIVMVGMGIGVRGGRGSWLVGLGGS